MTLCKNLPFLNPSPVCTHTVSYIKISKKKILSQRTFCNLQSHLACKHVCINQLHILWKFGEDMCYQTLILLIFMIFFQTQGSVARIRPRQDFIRNVSCRRTIDHNRYMLIYGPFLSRTFLRKNSGKIPQATNSQNEIPHNNLCI